MTIRVALADDHQLVLTTLAFFVDAQLDMRTVVAAADGAELMRALRQTSADVLVLDLVMRGLGGADTLGRLVAHYPDMPILVLSGQPAKLHALQLIKRGAAGYLEKTCDPQEVIDAIRTVAAGSKYFSAEVSELLAEHATGKSTEISQLTEREYQILLRLVRGQKNAQIAADLHLTPETVATYRTRLMRKLNVRNLGELIRLAVSKQLLE